MENFKVGEKVEFEYSNTDKCPCWNWAMLESDENVIIKQGVVLLSSHDQFTVQYDEHQHWSWPQPSGDEWQNHELYVRRAVDKKTPNTTPVWVEVIESYVKSEIPSVVMSAAIDRGEKGVRRITRSWPTYHILEHKVITENKPDKKICTISWYFIPDPKVVL